MNKGRNDVRARPRLEGDRLNELLDIAAEVFISTGFQSASTNVIAKQARTSKASLYSRFPSKEDLFSAVLERKINEIFEKTATAIRRDGSMRDNLMAFGREVLGAIFSDVQLALVRVISMETARFPQLGQRFVELGPGRGISLLSRYIETQIQSGALRDGSAQRMAEHFFGMIGGLPLLFRLLGTDISLRTEQQRDAHLADAVDAFLNAYRKSK